MYGTKVFDNCSLRARDKKSFGHSEILVDSKEAPDFKAQSVLQNFTFFISFHPLSVSIDIEQYI